MNEKKIKQLRKKVKPLQVEWMKSLLSEEEAEKINIKNIKAVLPEDTHVIGNGIILLSFMSDKWVMKMLKNNPNIDSFDELFSIYKTKQERFIDGSLG